jgi:hypothetical protein
VDDQDMLECFLDFPAISPQHPFALDHATSNQSFASKPNQHGPFPNDTCRKFNAAFLALFFCDSKHAF